MSFMLKTIKLKLTNVQYSGDSIGDDIRIEVEVLGKLLSIDKKIKVGTSVTVGQDIGSFETDQKIFKTIAYSTVIEKDILFNDQGNTQGTIRVDTTLQKPQRFTYDVKVKETRSIFGKQWSKKTALFTLTLEAIASDSLRYTPDEGDGWLKAILENTKSIVELPAFLQVRIDYADGKREYFTILEGPYRGMRASVKLSDDSSSQFIANIHHESFIQAQYSVSKKLFFLNGKKYQTTDYQKAKWEKRFYDIEIPDYAHQRGARYMEEAKRAKTWFRIGHSGDKYLHAGGVSLGCITIIERKRWMEIYSTLIKARKGDFTSVGVLEVID